MGHSWVETRKAVRKALSGSCLDAGLQLICRLNVPAAALASSRGSPI
jgi:hypothetical protein